MPDYTYIDYHKSEKGQQRVNKDAIRQEFARYGVTYNGDGSEFVVRYDENGNALVSEEAVHEAVLRKTAEAAETKRGELALNELLALQTQRSSHTYLYYSRDVIWYPLGNGLYGTHLLHSSRNCEYNFDTARLGSFTNEMDGLIRTLGAFGREKTTTCPVCFRIRNQETPEDAIKMEAIQSVLQSGKWHKENYIPPKLTAAPINASLQNTAEQNSTNSQNTQILSAHVNAVSQNAAAQNSANMQNTQAPAGVQNTAVKQPTINRTPTPAKQDKEIRAIARAEKKTNTETKKENVQNSPTPQPTASVVQNTNVQSDKTTLPPHGVEITDIWASAIFEGCVSFHFIIHSADAPKKSVPLNFDIQVTHFGLFGKKTPILQTNGFKSFTASYCSDVGTLKYHHKKLADGTQEHEYSLNFTTNQLLNQGKNFGKFTWSITGSGANNTTPCHREGVWTY